MKKKLIIIGSSVVFVVGLIVLLSFTLFALREVRVDYRTSFTQDISEEEIIESGKFAYKASVFFHGKEKYIENIEKAYPYVNVINIETVFPSSFVVHIAQRQEVYALEYNGSYLICDEEFKVLKIENDYIATQENAIRLEGVTFQNETVNIGDYLNIEGYYDFYNASVENNHPLSSMKTIIENISFSTVLDENIGQIQPNVQLSLFDGQVYIIKNCSYGLRAKVKLFYDLYSQVYTYIGQTVIIDGEEVVLTEENLKNATFKIDNYYDYTQYDENDCYFDISQLTK